ncbi:mitochondrial import receptor subunit Tom22 [Microbotryomycetes sp. JL221]|nr:mitochondrial import receptor subunit Tom22 [Microbotryomycetes sp. JL221]
MEELTGMVRITDIKDEDEWSDSSSVVESVADDHHEQLDEDDDLVSESELQLYDPSQETIKERLYALKDMVPPETRKTVRDVVAATTQWSKWSIAKAGSAAWIVTTSALVVGLPLMLSIEGEAALVQQEKEYLGQASAQQQQALGAPGAMTAPAGIVPAGF